MLCVVSNSISLRVPEVRMKNGCFRGQSLKDAQNSERDCTQTQV